MQSVQSLVINAPFSKSLSWNWQQWNRRWVCYPYYTSLWSSFRFSFVTDESCFFHQSDVYDNTRNWLFNVKIFYNYAAWNRTWQSGRTICWEERQVIERRARSRVSMNFRECQFNAREQRLIILLVDATILPTRCAYDFNMHSPIKPSLSIFFMRYITGVRFHVNMLINRFSINYFPTVKLYIRRSVTLHCGSHYHFPI